MRRKFSVLLSLLLLCVWYLPVYAAPAVLPITHINGYSHKLEGVDGEYTIPFTGNYTITLAGAQGANYGSSVGGGGTTPFLTKTIRLHKDDKIMVELPMPIGYSIDGSVVKVPGGSPAKLYLWDDEAEEYKLLQVAPGGAATCKNNIAPDDVLTVELQNGNGASEGSWSSASVHWHRGPGVSSPKHSNKFPTLSTRDNPGGCYTNHWHDHDSKCSYREWHTHENCPWKEWTEHPDGGNYWDEGAVVVKREQQHTACEPHSEHKGDTRDNRWALGCGKQQGQICGIPRMSFGTCYDASWQTLKTSSGATKYNSGVAKFTIELAEQSDVFYNDIIASKLQYFEDPEDINVSDSKNNVELILSNDTVAYYKPR